MELSKGQPSSSENSVASHRLRLLSCLVFPLVLSLLIALLFEPLRLYQAEDYLALARQSSGVPPSLFRPPGYVAFLRFINAVGGPISNDRAWPIYVGQGLVLGLATVAWYVIACRWLAPSAACLMALTFGCNPLMVVLVGYIHYDILHVGMSVMAGLLLVRAFANQTASLRWATLAGIAGGVLTLVRPMTLVVPAFLALALGLLAKRAGSSRTWLAWAVFSLAMAATIAPKTWSNYDRTGQFIPVNAQFWSQLWPMFEEPIKLTSENYPWISLVPRRLAPLVEKQLGPSNLNDEGNGQTHPLTIENICRARVRELIGARSGLYFSNFIHNAVFFLAGDSRLRVRAFVFCQCQDIYLHPTTWATGFFVAASAFLHVCGVLGLALGLWRRDPTVTILAALFICLWIVHSMVYLDYRFVYVKLPFMLWFTGYLMNEYFKTRSSGKKAMTWIATAFAMSSLLGTALLVF
jgi:hypothetical protein